MRIGPARFPSPHPVTRLVPLGAALCIVGVVTVWSTIDARARRVERERDRVVRMHAAQLAGPELALHSASRWLRHPTRSEPWAASADGPAMLDLDPAGALAPPPGDAVRAGFSGTRITLTPGTR